ncbi:MAG: hypothetical protein NC418_00875 [Muribaculaceae bacterium]|nr:hypothetical protein [Muribaculaceae bacterium]
MKQIIYKFGSLLLSLAMILGLTACSDSSSDEPTPEKPYEMIYSSTMMLRQAWKITEHEYSDKSYYTKDFKTSWVINQGFTYGGQQYFPFSYKLSLQSEIHYVPTVEVGAFPNGDLCIVDAESYQPIFFIEDMHSGGNKDVMIIRDREGNRFRCESVSDARIYFLENCTSKTSLKLHYVQAFDYNTTTEIDYTVASLPQNVLGAYSVLVEKGDALVIDITSADGGYAQLTSSNLTSYGYMRGEITDEGLSYGGNDPTPGPSGEFDTAAEEAIKGVFVADLGYFFINIEAEGKPLISYNDGYYNVKGCQPGIRVRNFEDGTKWIVNASDGAKLLRLNEIAPDRSYINLSTLNDNDHMIYRAAPDATVAYFINGSSSYDTLYIDYKSYTNGGKQTIHGWREVVSRYDDSACGVPLLWTDRTSPIELSVSIEAKNTYLSELKPTTFDYTVTIPAGNLTLQRITITDADIRKVPTKEEIAQLEAFLWQKGKVRAWRLQSYANAAENNGEIQPAKEDIWMITETVTLDQGFHSNLQPDKFNGNFYIEQTTSGFLVLKSWDGKASMEILSSVSEIIDEGKLAVRFGSSTHYYVAARKPLVAYCQLAGNHIVGSRRLEAYNVDEVSGNGTVLSSKKVYGRPLDLAGYPATAGWALIADEHTYGEESYFDIWAHVIDYNSSRTYYYSQLKCPLGSLVKISVED